MTLGIEIGICAPGDAAHALDHAATDETHDIHQMRPLAVDQPAALGGVELGRQARALQPIVGIKRADLDDLADPPARNHLADRLDGRLVDLRMALQELDPVLARRRDHAVAFPQSHRHGLFADDMLAVAGGADRVLCMQGIGGRYPDRVDVVLGAKLRHAGEDGTMIYVGEGRPGLGTVVRAPGQNIGLVFAEGGQYLARGDAKPGDTDPEPGPQPCARLRHGRLCAWPGTHPAGATGR